MDRETRFLIVDDSHADRRVMARALGSAGFRNITEVESGEGALEKLRAQPFDVVISDYSMQYLDGIGLLEIVRRDHPETCRVLVTGHGHFELARDAINRAGVHAFLTKPIAPAQLPDVLKAALARAREQSALGLS